jgi:hypothetical protein
VSQEAGATVGTSLFSKNGIISPPIRAAAMPSIIHLGAAATELATFDGLKDAEAMARAGGNRVTNRPAIAVASFSEEHMSGKPMSV